MGLTVSLRVTARGAYLKLRRRREPLLAGALIRGRGAYSNEGGGAYLTFPKLQPEMFTFLVYHVRINTNISCLLT